MRETTAVQITPPNIKWAVFNIEGTAPLVVHRFEEKVKAAFRKKIEEGSKPTTKNRFEPKDTDEICEAAKYIGETKGKKWEGFNASGVRNALISACRGAGFKMTIGKQSLFCEQDGWDIYTPLIPLVRIQGEAKKSELIGKTETGVAMLTIRPMYFPWSASLRIRYDADMFKVSDVTNLLARAGMCVGICEGRPDSKNSCGMGWGTFQITNTKEQT